MSKFLNTTTGVEWEIEDPDHVARLQADPEYTPVDDTENLSPAADLQRLADEAAAIAAREVSEADEFRFKAEAEAAREEAARINAEAAQKALNEVLPEVTKGEARKPAAKRTPAPRKTAAAKSTVKD